MRRKSCKLELQKDRHFLEAISLTCDYFDRNLTKEFRTYVVVSYLVEVFHEFWHTIIDGIVWNMTQS